LKDGNCEYEGWLYAVIVMLQGIMAEEDQSYLKQHST